ncbi:MAG: hypothetical protein ACTSX2_01945 [Candidatus Thorarchaeota archaeon]
MVTIDGPIDKGKVDISILADVLLKALLLLMMPIIVSVSKYVETDGSTQLTVVGLFYTVVDSRIVLTSNPLLVIITLFSISPVVYYKYKINRRGRKLGSMNLVYRCFVISFILVLLTTFFLSSNAFDIGYITLSNLYISGVGLIGSYVSLLVLFMVIYPEIYYQFNTVVSLRKLRQSSDSPIQRDAPRDSEASLYGRLKNRLPGLFIAASMAFILLIIVQQFRITDTFIDSHVGILTPFIFISYSAMTTSLNLVMWSVNHFLLSAIEMSGDLLFVHQFLKYLLNRTTKLRLLLVTILSYWGAMAQLGYSLVALSLTSGSTLECSFLIPIVQIVSFLLLMTGILKRIDFKIEPEEPPETMMPTGTTEILVKVPILYLIKSKMWGWKYGKHKRSD